MEADQQALLPTVGLKFSSEILHSSFSLCLFSFCFSFCSAAFPSVQKLFSKYCIELMFQQKHLHFFSSTAYREISQDRSTFKFSAQGENIY